MIRAGRLAAAAAGREALFVVCVVVLSAACNALWYSSLDFPRNRSSHAVLALVLAAVLVAVFRGVLGLRLTAQRAEARWVALSAPVLLALALVASQYRVVWEWGRQGALLLDLFEIAELPEYDRLHSFVWTAGSALLIRALLPLLLIRGVLARPLRDFGWGRPILTRTAWLYPVAYLVLVPLPWWVSARSDFLDSYPQCQGLIEDDAIALSRLLSFQLAYVVLLASGESFWRGYLLFGLERQLGRLPALLYMASLYSLSHYGKPYLETSLSFVAGCVLGWLALRHRSFWLGFSLHLAVAWSMEGIALLRRGVDFIAG